MIDVQVPNERDRASTVRVDVEFPNGIYVASPATMPGWKRRVITKRLSRPVEIEPGFSVSSRVDRVVITGGRIGPGRFLSFPISIKAPTSKAGTLLTFKTLQTYSNGDVVRWIGNPTADAPAPQVLIRSASSPVLDYPAGANSAKQSMGKTMTGFAFGLPLGARSAGSDPGEEINPAVAQAMAEVGVDMSEEFPKPLTDEVVRAADVVITMGCGDACPIYPGKRYEDWTLEDPAGQDVEAARRIRDEIDSRVQRLIADLVA